MSSQNEAAITWKQQQSLLGLCCSVLLTPYWAHIKICTTPRHYLWSLLVSTTDIASVVCSMGCEGMQQTHWVIVSFACVFMKLQHIEFWPPCTHPSTHVPLQVFGGKRKAAKVLLQRDSKSVNYLLVRQKMGQHSVDPGTNYRQTCIIWHMYHQLEHRCTDGDVSSHPQKVNAKPV